MGMCCTKRFSARAREIEIRRVATFRQPEHESEQHRDQRHDGGILRHGDLPEEAALVRWREHGERPERGWREGTPSGIDAQVHEDVVLAGAPAAAGQREEERPVPVARDRLLEAAAIADRGSVQVDGGVHAHRRQQDRGIPAA
jgi:hypothetical protein